MQTLESKKNEYYLHLYLGAEYRVRYIDYQAGEYTVWSYLNAQRLGKLDDASIGEIQLRLRQLSDMSEEENNEFITLAGKCDYEVLWGKSNQRSNKKLIGVSWEELGSTGLFFNTSAGSDFFEIFRWLLSKHFDIFGLIPVGLAIEKTQKQ